MTQSLIIFRTEHCGWGVRAATQIPAGTYLCDYFGELMYENTAMEQYEQNLYESDTVAMLNFIEVAEGSKRSEPRESKALTGLLSDFEKDYRDNYDEGKISTNYIIGRFLG